MSVEYLMTKVSRGVDCTPDLNNTYWVDSGLESDSEETIYYDTSRTYGYWHDGSKWYVTIVADVDGSPTNYFEQVAEDAVVAAGSWSGQLQFEDYTVSDAWRLAEDTCFDSLTAFLGNAEGRDCFRGFLPVNADGTLKFANVWMFTSGGTAGGFDIGRTYGEAGNWCALLIDAEVEGVFEGRNTAMRFANSVLAWLKSTSNMQTEGNVTWCHLRGLPEAPEEVIAGNRRYWRVSVPLEILYLTESVHADD